MVAMKTKEQALRDLGRVVAESAAIVSKLTVREAAERVYYPGGPSVDELMVRIAVAEICREDDPEGAQIRTKAVRALNKGAAQSW